MKYLVVLTIALFAFAAANEQSNAIHERCIEEAGLTKEQVESLYTLQMSDDKEIKDYMLCNVKKHEVFDEETGYNVERLMELFDTMKLDNKKAREIVTKCNDNNEQKSSAADWVYRVARCMTVNKMDDLFKEAQDRIKKEHTNEA